VASEAPVGRYGAPEFAAYFLGTLFVRHLTGAWVVWQMNEEIRTGELSMRLLKPVHPFWIYASEKARFGQPEVNLGLIPGFGGTSRLPRRVGVAWAKEMVLTGEPLTAEEALRIGLVNRVFEPEALLPRAIAAGETIAAKGPVAVALAKRVIQEGQDAELRQAHALEQQAFGLVFASEDRAEGMDAFLEKRDPVFSGR